MEGKLTQLPPPARFVGSSSRRRRRAGPSGPSGSGCLQSIHPPLTSQHQSSLLPSHSHSKQKPPPTSELLPKRRQCYLLGPLRVSPAVVLRPRDCSSSPLAALGVTAVAEWGWWGCAAAPRQPRPGEGCWPPGPRRTQRGDAAPRPTGTFLPFLAFLLFNL